MDRTQSAGLRPSSAERLELITRRRLDTLNLRMALVLASVLQTALASALLFANLSDLTLVGGLPTLSGAAALLSAGFAVIVVHAKPGLQRQTFVRDGAARAIDREHLNHLKDQVCHELRTPLNAVIGFSEMMQRELLGPVGNERYREYAGHIRDSAEQFHSATEKTLTAAALLAAPTPGPRERFRLCDILDSELNHSLCVDTALELEGCRTAIAGGLAHLIEASRALGHDCDTCTTLTTSQDHAGSIDIAIRVDATRHAPLVRGNGFDLALLLARLHLAAGGLQMDDEWSGDRRWCATVRLPGCVAPR